MADNPILKKKNRRTIRNRKEGRKEKRRKEKNEKKKERKEEKERKKRKGKKGKEKEREIKDQSVDRSSQAGNFSISLADAMQYLFQEGTKALLFSYVSRSTF